MYTNMNFPAPLAVLGFLVLCAGLAAAVITTIVALLLGKPRLVRWTWRLAAIAGIAYFVLLIGFSIASRERLLHQGEEKYFCEIDCHLAYSLVDVKYSANPTQPLKHYQVTVRTRFDEKTVSERRGDGSLTPNPRIVRLIDSAGREYAPTESEELAFNAALHPGESYNVALTFDVPADARNLKLLITTEHWPERLLIGDENSLLHGRIYFALST